MRERTIILIIVAILVGACVQSTHDLQKPNDYKAALSSPPEGESGQKSVYAKAVLVNRSAPTGLIGVPVATPKNWPRKHPFRPLRHFGPFVTGSELERIKLHLSGNADSADSPTLGARLYFGDFFDVASPQLTSILELYFQGRRLPSTPAPLPDRTTLEVRPTPMALTGTGTHDLLFELARIRYTSQFGGSVAFDFKLSTMPSREEFAAGDPPYQAESSAEDFDFEFYIKDGTDQLLFDVPDLKATVYVVPTEERFNRYPSSQSPGFHRLQFTYSPLRITAYRNTTIIPFAEVKGLFIAAVRSLESGLSVRHPGAGDGSETLDDPSYYPIGDYPMEKLAYAWLHDQFSHFGMISGNQLVTKLLISDQWVDVVTRDPIPYFFVRTKLSVSGGRTGDEYQVGVSWKHFYDPPGGTDESDKQDQSFVGYSYRVSDGDWMGWFPIGGFSLQDCEVLDRIEVTLDVERFDDEEFDLEIDCSTIANAFSSNDRFTGVVNAIQVEDPDDYPISAWQNAFDAYQLTINLATDEGESTDISATWHFRVFATLR